MPVVEIAEQTLSQEGIEYMRTAVKQINQNKAAFITALSSLPLVKKIHPSDANFILVEMTDAEKVHEYLKSEHIYVKKQSGQLSHCMRISIGTEQEMRRVIQALSNYR